MSYELPDHLAGLVSSIFPVGSRVTCNPAPTDTDADYLVLVSPENAERFLIDLGVGGYEAGGSRVEHNSKELMAGDEAFMSFTHGEVNLIVTSSRSFHTRFLAATSVAKRLNVMAKEDRVYLFQAVLYGNGWQDLMEPVRIPPSPTGFPPPAEARTWEQELDDLI